jgi:hypothetical protein
LPGQFTKKAEEYILEIRLSIKFMIIGSEIWACRNVLVEIGRGLPQQGATQSYGKSESADGLTQKGQLEDVCLTKKSPGRAAGRDTFLKDE